MTATATNTVRDAALAKDTSKGTAIKHIAETKGEIFHVNPYLLEDSGKNFRNLTTPEAREKLMNLARSIASNGVLEALTAYHENGKNIVSNGHRRLAATKIAIEELGAEVETVPVRLAPRGTNDADHRFDQYIRNSGEPPTVLETAILFKDQLGLGWTEEKLIAKSGLDKPTVVRYLDIAALPAEIHGMIERGEVAATFALQRHKVNRENGSVTVEELKKTLETAQAEGKDKATAQFLPAAAPVTAGLRKARTPKVRKGDAPVRVSEKEVIRIISVMMRTADLTKYDRDGTRVEATVGWDEADFLKIREFYRL